MLESLCSEKNVHLDGDKIYIFTANQGSFTVRSICGGFYQFTREVQPSSTHRSEDTITIRPFISDCGGKDEVWSCIRVNSVYCLFLSLSLYTGSVTSGGSRSVTKPVRAYRTHSPTVSRSRAAAAGPSTRPPSGSGCCARSRSVPCRCRVPNLWHF